MRLKITGRIRFFSILTCTHRRLNYNHEIREVPRASVRARSHIRHPRFIFREYSVRRKERSARLPTLQLSNAAGNSLFSSRRTKMSSPDFDPTLSLLIRSIDRGREDLKGREVTSKVGNKSCRECRGKKKNIYDREKRTQMKKERWVQAENTRQLEARSVRMTTINHT